MEARSSNGRGGEPTLTEAGQHSPSARAARAMHPEAMEKVRFACSLPALAPAIKDEATALREHAEPTGSEENAHVPSRRTAAFPRRFPGVQSGRQAQAEERRAAAALLRRARGRSEGARKESGENDARFLFFFVFVCCWLSFSLFLSFLWHRSPPFSYLTCITVTLTKPCLTPSPGTSAAGRAPASAYIGAYCCGWY